MLTKRDDTLLLKELLLCHICPPTKKFIADTRKKFKALRKDDYPIEAKLLEKNIIKS